MASLTVSLTLASPLLAGEPHQGNTYHSFSYLPGSVLRGAVANVLMAGWTHEARQIPHPEACPDPAGCTFCRVLYPRDAAGQPGRPPRFFDCYPAAGGGEVVQPFPLTARTCKRFPGFLRENDPDERHGIFDTLIAQAAARDAGGANTPYVYALECPQCGEALTGPDTIHYGRSDAYYYVARPINRRFSRTAINRRRHTAQAGQLFTLTVMGDQMRVDLPDPAPRQVATRLEGSVETGDADEAALRDALARVGWLGSGNSRGLGQVEVQVTSPFPGANGGLTLARFQEQVTAGQFRPDPDAPADLGNRLAGFNQAVAAERDFYRSLGVDVLPGRWYFTIDVCSETFVRHQGLPTLDLSPAILNLPGATQDFVVVEPIERGGWSNAWGLPRPRELGIQTGSVFLFRVDSDDPPAVARLYQRLAELEETGIGANQARGAGRLQVCAPFHQEVNPT